MNRGVSLVSKSSTDGILLADDDPNDREIIIRAFRKTGFGLSIHALSSGDEVIMYLAGQAEYVARAQFPLPKLVILDASLLIAEGWEPLKWIRRQQQFNTLPVFVLTGSELPGHREKAENLGATLYILKPHSLDDLVREMKRLVEFWMRIPI